MAILCFPIKEFLKGNLMYCFNVYILLTGMKG